MRVSPLSYACHWEKAVLPPPPRCLRNVVLELGQMKDEFLITGFESSPWSAVLVKAPLEAEWK